MATCEKGQTFEEKELAILREAVDKAEERSGKKIAQSPQIKGIINIVENFLRKKKLVCYGGTAINNILPMQDQFYNKDVEIPDYDFFSPKALEDAKELADIYEREGYDDVEAKAGVHHGTFKVYVSFIPVADITFLTPPLFKAVSRESIRVNGILYAPPNYLRMAMYLELSRPAGDVSRWEKVLKRLTLLNKAYPMKNPRCQSINFQRDFEGPVNKKEEIYFLVRDSLIDQGLVFFGGYAANLYSRYMPARDRKRLGETPDFDVLSEDPETSATIVKERLLDADVKDVRIYKKPGIGEIIAPHYEISIGDETVAVIYEPLACHSYNTIRIGRNIVKVATIDTMLSFYLAFLYADRSYYDHERLLCMSQYLFTVQSKNRLKQKGLLKRFSINCYGKQSTMEDIRADKAKMFQELKGKRGTKEYDEYFLRYVPGEGNKKKNKAKKLSPKKKKGTRRKAKRPAAKKRRATKKQRKAVKNRRQTRRRKRVLNIET